MKSVHAVVIIALVCLIAGGASAQFKSQVEQESRISEGVLQRTSPSLLFGWFNPEKFHMRHSVSFSYHTMGDHSMSLGTYTNSMMYEFADNLNARADVSLSYSPFNSYSGAFGGDTKKALSSIYLSRAEVNYRPWETVIMQIQFRQVPYGMYSPYYSPWYREDGF
ncbi:MAG: hypothetical protein IT282_06760 [Bacteroidetes bacterium]|nr:hypothetical protein [Bacteroidota bacterium]